MVAFSEKKVQGLGFKVQDSKLRFQVSGLRINYLGIANLGI
jgi:hypothetical protein